MIILRPIVFIVTLAFGFVLSQNLDGILKIREGAFELATSFTEEVKNEETPQASTDASKYLQPSYWKYGAILVGVFSGLFTATLVGAAALGFLGGVLFSPEISAYPFLGEYAFVISENVKSLMLSIFKQF